MKFWQKGSLPLLNIPAHDAKIYGIDWSRVSADEIVTCSLDKTIKFWDIAALESKQDSFARGGGYTHLPTKEIPTTYPVWRARHLPFGHGVLSLPQRGKNTLEMYRDDQLDDPIMRFEGHTGVVKEYVWRVKGGQDLEHGDIPRTITPALALTSSCQMIVISNLSPWQMIEQSDCGRSRL